MPAAIATGGSLPSSLDPTAADRMATGSWPIYLSKNGSKKEKFLFRGNGTGEETPFFGNKRMRLSDDSDEPLFSF